MAVRSVLSEGEDIRLLPGSRVDHGRVPALEAKTGREVQVAVVPLCPPRADEEEGDPFVVSVLKNHVLVTGIRL